MNLFNPFIRELISVEYISADPFYFAMCCTA